MYAQGLHPELNFENLDQIREVYERTTRMTVHDRHPYGGDLVFTAFPAPSGCNQEGHGSTREEGDSNETLWQVPYLSIDPRDLEARKSSGLTARVEKVESLTFCPESMGLICPKQCIRKLVCSLTKRQTLSLGNYPQETFMPRLRQNTWKRMIH